MVRKPQVTVPKTPPFMRREREREKENKEKGERKREHKARAVQRKQPEITVPETPAFAKRRDRRAKPLSSEEMELREIAEKKKKLEVQRRQNRERLAAMQNHANYEQRYLRTHSNFTPKRTQPLTDKRKENVRHDTTVASRYQPNKLTVAQPFSFATDRRGQQKHMY